LPLALLTVLLGSLIGLLVAIPFLVLNRRRFWRFKWPYGSFLGAAGIYACLWGNQLLEAYLRWCGFVHCAGPTRRRRVLAVRKLSTAVSRLGLEPRSPALKGQ